MELKDIVKQRYAVRKFDGKKLPESKVEELLEIIRLAPSSYNIQPWKILVITDQKLKEKLAPAAWNQPQITSCSHLLVFCANTDIKENIMKIESDLIKAGAKKEDIKGYIDLMLGFLNQLPESQRLSWAQKQTYIALGNALNGAKSLGFDSAPMEGFQPSEFSKILNLPNNIVPSVLCAIGNAADEPKPKFRFSEDYTVEKRY